MFQKSVVRGETRNRETRKAVAKAALQNKTTDESGWSSRGYAENRSTTTFFKHLLRREWRVTLANHAVVMGRVRRRIVEQVAAELTDARAGIHLNRFVNVTLFPVALGPIEQPQLSIRIPAAAANPTILIERAAGDEKGVRQVCFRKDLKYLDHPAQFIRNSLVGVETEDPIVLCLFDRKLLLRAEAGPRIDDHSRAAVRRNVARRIGGIGVDDEDLVSPGDGFAGGLDIRFFIERDDGGADLHSDSSHKEAQKAQKAQ